MDKKAKNTPAKPLNKKRVAIISLAAVLLVAVVTLIIVLTGGEKVAKVSNSKDTYLSADGFTITKGELYDALKTHGAEILSTLIDDKIFSQIEVDYEKDEVARQKLDDVVNSAIYGTENQNAILENYEGLSYETEANKQLKVNIKKRTIESYVSNLFLVNPKINKNDLISKLHATTTDYYKIDVLATQYRTSVAKHLLAKKLLDEELEKQKEDDLEAYESSLFSQFKGNEYVDYDIDLFYVKFINATEGQQYLNYFGLVADARGTWYQLPILPKNDAGTKYYGSFLTSTQVRVESATDLDGEDPYQVEIKEHLKSIKNVYDNDGVKHDNLFVLFGNKGYVPNRYYTQLHTLLKNNIVSLKLVALDDKSVLEAFVKIHNELNGDSLKVLNENDKLSILNSDSEPYNLRYQNKDSEDGEIKGYSTLFPNASTIRGLGNANNMQEDDKNPFVSNISSVTNFLIFKFDSYQEYDKSYLNEDEDGFAEDKLDDALEAVLLESIKKSRLNATYVSTKVTDYKKDLVLNIYDEKMRLLYDMSNDYKGKTKVSKTLVLDLKLDDFKFQLTADEFYELLESYYGVNVSLDLLLKKVLLADNSPYKVTKEEKTKFESDYNTLLQNFAANAFESNGYPASIGREKFLKLIFDADNKKDAITNGYVIPRLKELYSQHYEAHYSNVYEGLAELAGLQYDNYMSITVGHLLVYVDVDYSGTPVNPDKYFENDPAGKLVFEEKVLELVNKIKALNVYNTVAELQVIINKYNSIGRYEIENNSIFPNEANQFVEYRKLGIGLKYESISSAVTNTSNFLSGSSRLDQVFYDRAVELYNKFAEKDEDGKYIFDAETFERPYIDSVANVAGLEKVRSAFGYHFIILDNSGTKATFMDPVNPSAAFNDAEFNFEITEADALFNNAKTYSLNNEEDKLSASQIEYYLNTKRTTVENKGLPTSSTSSKVTTAFSSFFTPVETMYSNNYHQRHLTFKLLDQYNLSFADAAKLSYYQEVKAINLAQFFSFLQTEGGFMDANYEALYGQWFTLLNA